MRFPLIRFLFKMVGTELLFKEMLRLFHKELYVVKDEVNKRLARLLVKCLVWLFVIILLIIGCVFVLLALALYLNEIFYSSYKGFLAVGGGALLVVVLVVIIMSMRGTKYSN